MYFKEQPSSTFTRTKSRAKRIPLERERERKRISAASFALCSCAPESSSRASSRAVFQRKRIKKTFALGKSYPEEGPRLSLARCDTRTTFTFSKRPPLLLRLRRGKTGKDRPLLRRLLGVHVVRVVHVVGRSKSSSCSPLCPKGKALSARRMGTRTRTTRARTTTTA